MEVKTNSDYFTCTAYSCSGPCSHEDSVPDKVFVFTAARGIFKFICEKHFSKSWIRTLLVIGESWRRWLGFGSFLANPPSHPSKWAPFSLSLCLALVFGSSAVRWQHLLFCTSWGNCKRRHETCYTRYMLVQQQYTVPRRASQPALNAK